MNNLGGNRMVYNLAGLKMIFWSQIAVYALSLLGAIFENSNMVTGLVGILTFVATVIMIVGVFKISRYNHHYGKCKTWMIVSIVLGVVVVIALLITAFSGGLYLSSWGTEESDRLGTLLPFLLVVIVVSLTSIVISMLYAYHFFYGCSQVAQNQGDYTFAEKCKNSWKLYWICFIIGVVAGIVAVSGLMTSLAMSDLADGLPILPIIVAIILIVAVLVMEVKMLQITYLTYKKYDGNIINGPAGPAIPEIPVTPQDLQG